MKYHARDYLAVLGSHAALLLAVYSFTRYDGLQKLFAALRVEVFFLLLFGLLIFPLFGMDALTVWESVQKCVSSGVHALLGILYA